MARPTLVLAVIVLAAAIGVETDERSDLALRARVATYVRDLENALPFLIADESYFQIASWGLGVPPVRRTLEGEFAWIRLLPSGEVIGIREVGKVDGRAVGERTDRVTALMTAPPGEASTLVQEIINDNARHNLGGVRNFNVPTFPLLFVAPASQTRSRWRVEGRQKGRAVLAFEEVARPTVIRTAAGRDIPVRGKFWVDEPTGRIERSEILLSEEQEVEVYSANRPGAPQTVRVVPRMTYRMTVTYAPVAALALWLPEKLEDSYERAGVVRRGSATVADERGNTQTVTGNARYRNYRRFQTDGRLVEPQ